MQEWQYPPAAVTLPELVMDPYRCGFDVSATLSGAEAEEQWGDEDWRVPPQGRPAEGETPWPDGTAPGGDGRRCSPGSGRLCRLRPVDRNAE